MRCAVIGSRSFKDFEKMERILQCYNITEIISGGAKGADSLAAQYAQQRGVKLTIFKPNWKEYGRAAGIKRNREIIDAADIVIAFWDRVSKGTESSISLAEKAGKKAIIVDITE